MFLSLWEKHRCDYSGFGSIANPIWQESNTLGEQNEQVAPLALPNPGYFSGVIAVVFRRENVVPRASESFSIKEKEEGIWHDIVRFWPVRFALFILFLTPA